MKEISDFLNKFRRLLSNKTLQRQMIIEAIKEKTGLSLLAGHLDLRNEAAFLKNLSPAARSQIFLQRTRILEELKSKGVFLKDLR